MSDDERMLEIATRLMAGMLGNQTLKVTSKREGASDIEAIAACSFAAADAILNEWRERTGAREAQRIARVKLRELATAAGHKTPEYVEDTESLYGRPIMAEVYRAKEPNEKYAEDDGKKPRIGQFLSVKRYKQEVEGVAAPASERPAKSKPASRPAPAPEDDEIPF